MTGPTGQQTPTPTVDKKPRRKHHWWRWTLAVVVVLTVLVVAAGAFSKPPPATPPLVLPTAAAIAPVGPLEGTWNVAAGSTAGFRVRETFLGMSDDSTGRTNAVTGTLAIAGDQVTAATFTVDLTTMQVGGKPQPQFATSLDTLQFPTATFTLTQPVMLGSAFTSGTTTTTTAPGRLTLHGTSHPRASPSRPAASKKRYRSPDRSPSHSPTGASPDPQDTAPSGHSPTTAPPSS